jgi:hypothetical protein
VYAQLQEQRIGTNWYTVDETIVLFGNWPRANGIISTIGPGGGVIRLDPGYIGLAPFNPLTSVGILGSLTVPEGSSLTYTGQAIYANGSIHDFTDTAWASSRFTITPNGVFTAGSVTSNTSVLISAPYSYGGFLYSASSKVIVSDLPPPTFSGLSLIANGSFTMTLGGVPGRSHVIEATTNLTPPTVWVPLATNATDTNGLLSLTNSSVTDFPRHFFRAREL